MISLDDAVLLVYMELTGTPQSRLDEYARTRQIEDGDAGLQLLDEAHGLQPIRRLAHDLKTVTLQQGLEAFLNNQVVIS